MARKRKTATNPRQSTPDFQISTEEQLRLIEQTGILKKVPDREPRANSRSTPPRASEENDDDEEYPLAEEIFSATTLLIPMSFLLLLMYM